MQVRPIDAEATYQSMVQTIAAMMTTRRWMRRDESNEDEILSVIQDAPTLDYAPVRHGHFGFVGGSAIAVYMNFGTCSECKERVAFGQHKNYCPNCGAKMDGGADV